MANGCWVHWGCLPVPADEGILNMQLQHRTTCIPAPDLTHDLTHTGSRSWQHIMSAQSASLHCMSVPACQRHGQELWAVWASTVSQHLPGSHLCIDPYAAYRVPPAVPRCCACLVSPGVLAVPMTRSVRAIHADGHKRWAVGSRIHMPCGLSACELQRCVATHA